MHLRLPQKPIRESELFRGNISWIKSYFGKEVLTGQSFFEPRKTKYLQKTEIWKEGFEPDKDKTLEKVKAMLLAAGIGNKGQAMVSAGTSPCGEPCKCGAGRSKHLEDAAADLNSSNLAALVGIVGKLIREVRSRLSTGAFNVAAAPTTLVALSILLERAERVRTQQPKDKNKLYALHAPEVECISKGKARIRYEFGVKVSLAVTHKQGLIVGAKRFVGNPYGGHTLAAQISQSNELIKSTGSEIKQAFVDLGYRGVDADNPGVEVVHRGRIKSMGERQKRQLKRRQAIEPAIGHVKHDNRMIRCYLRSSLGDALHAISCAAGYNIRWLMRAIIRLGLRGLFAFAFLAAWFTDMRRFDSAKVRMTNVTRSAAAIRTNYASIRILQGRLAKESSSARS